VPVIAAQVAARLAAGKVIRVPIPGGFITKRYLGGRLVLAGTTPTITVTAFIQPRDMSSDAVPKAYADAITVS